MPQFRSRRLLSSVMNKDDFFLCGEWAAGHDC